MLSDAEVASLRRQRTLSALFSPLVYLFVLGAVRLRFGYTCADLRRFRAELWRKIDGHDGPVIWAANHLTLIDSFLVFWTLFTWDKIHRTELIPWSTPEYTNYYRLGGFLKQRAIRGLLYLCRCIPFLRGGEDEASVRWRQTAFEKCVWILKEGGSVFVYPEAGRSRKGWFERHKPKDFLGRLALEAPNAKFLCFYMRGDGQLYTTSYPAQGETFRVHGDLIDGPRLEEKTPREVSQRLFDRLAELQELWFKGGGLPKNCGGNDVIDLKSPAAREHFEAEPEPEWLERFLTDKERAYLDKAGEGRFRTFWKFVAAKEAAHKALAQSGIATPTGAYRSLEADLFLRRVTHLPTGAQTDIAFTDDDEEKVHCIAVLRGGWIGDEPAGGDVLWRVEEVPAGSDPSDFARERCLAFIAESSDEIGSREKLAFTEEGGIPKVLLKGRAQDWGVSLSHSGRFAAYSFMIS